jgi:hypothetical protein
VTVVLHSKYSTVLYCIPEMSLHYVWRLGAFSATALETQNKVIVIRKQASGTEYSEMLILTPKVMHTVRALCCIGGVLTQLVREGVVVVVLELL